MGTETVLLLTVLILVILWLIIIVWVHILLRNTIIRHRVRHRILLLLLHIIPIILITLVFRYVLILIHVLVCGTKSLWNIYWYWISGRQQIFIIIIGFFRGLYFLVRIWLLNGVLLFNILLLLIHKLGGWIRHQIIKKIEIILVISW